MSHSTNRDDRGPTPIIGYMLYVIVLCGLLAAIGIMWGVTQDRNWHGLSGVLSVLGSVRPGP